MNETQLGHRSSADPQRLQEDAQCACCMQRPKIPGRFCTVCGEIRACPQCSLNRGSSARFCRKCGLDLAALRHGPKPEGGVDTFSFIASPVEFQHRDTPVALQRAFAEFVSHRRVDPHRTACGMELLTSIAATNPQSNAHLRLDFRPYRALPRTVIQWPGTPPMAVLRHAWLEFSVTLLDHTELRLTVVSSVREAVVELPHITNKQQRPRRMEQVSELVLFSLHTLESAPLKPNSDDALRQRLGQNSWLRRISVRPESATLEYEFGPLYLYQGGVRDTIYRGYGLKNRMSPQAVERTVQAAYRALLDVTDECVLA